MKKETGLAIFLGVTLGIILSFVMILKTKDRRLDTTKTLTTEKKTQKIATDTAEVVSTFKLSEPQNRSIATTKNVLFKGVADKDSLVMIQSPIIDTAVKLEKTDFSIQVPLAMGENVIQITVYSKDPLARPQQKELRVYYLDEQ